VTHARCSSSSHDAAKRDVSVWQTWTFNGYYEVPSDLAPATKCEMRTCPKCSMSLSLPVDDDGRAMPEVYDCLKCGAQCSFREPALCWRCLP